MCIIAAPATRMGRLNGRAISTEKKKTSQTSGRGKVVRLLERCLQCKTTVTHWQSSRVRIGEPCCDSSTEWACAAHHWPFRPVTLRGRAWQVGVHESDKVYFHGSTWLAAGCMDTASMQNEAHLWDQLSFASQQFQQISRSVKVKCPTLASAPPALHRTGGVAVPATHGAPKSIKRSPLRHMHATKIRKVSSAVGLDSSERAPCMENTTSFAWQHNSFLIMKINIRLLVTGGHQAGSDCP